MCSCTLLLWLLFDFPLSMLFGALTFWGLEIRVRYITVTGEYSHVQGYDLTMDPKILTGVNRLEELALYVDALAHHSSLFATTFAEMSLSTSKGCVNLIRGVS